MYIAENIVFIDMPKCASSHIRRQVASVLPGRIRGTHRPASARLVSSGKVFWSSIRDPWDWYISLWAYGCSGRGALYAALTTDWGWLLSRGWKNSIAGAFPALLSNPRRYRKDWKASYGDVQDPACFQAWMHMLHSPRFAKALGDNYADGAVCGFSGLYTYRYLKLCCHGAFRHLTNKEAVSEFERSACYIDRFIRVEHLVDDLLESFRAAEIVLSVEQEQGLRGAGRTNRSARRQGACFYYDAATRSLVADRDSLIIDKFGYRPPPLTAERGG